MFLLHLSAPGVKYVLFVNTHDGTVLSSPERPITKLNKSRLASALKEIKSNTAQIFSCLDLDGSSHVRIELSALTGWSLIDLDVNWIISVFGYPPEDFRPEISGRMAGMWDLISEYYSSSGQF